MSTKPLTRLLCLLGLAAVTRADIDVPSDGSDGDLVTDVATKEIVIDLSKARPGRWDAPQTEPLQPEVGGVGTYDPEQWAVVFKYNRVQIARNVTVRFKNHASRAPVVWLVKGDVEIYGQVNLDGRSDAWHTGEVGPGGFRGAHWPEQVDGYRGYLNVAERGRWSPGLVPLLGGYGRGPAAGAGAMLIASRTRILLDGRLQAEGKQGASGGVFRLVADELAGGGFIETRGDPSTSGPGGSGRLEANRFTGSIRARFNFAVVPPEPLRIWPEPDAPTVRIVSVEDSPAPDDPRARLDAVAGPNGEPLGADMTIRKSGLAKVLIETRNLEPTAQTKVMLFALWNGARLISDPNVGATADMTPFRAALLPGGTYEKAQWLVEVNLPSGYTSLQVHAVGP